MDDDPTLLIVLLAVVAVVILKPDLLSSVFGGRGTTPTPANPLGPNTQLYQPPAANPGLAAWQASGHGDGSGRDPSNPIMPIGWRPGDPTWHSTTQAKADAKDAAFAREHPCPAGQFWNSLSYQCTELVDPNKPGQRWYGAPPNAQTPPPAPRAESSPPAAVSEIKASSRRAALFTPWS
ncbi:MAG: hypothetical protein ACJ8GN_02095 [Longimicrobiaceae bacterium]